MRDEHGLASAPEFWKHVVERGHAERWLSRDATDKRFWGKPHPRPAEFSGEHLHRMLRATDINHKLVAHIPEAKRQALVRGIAPKSVFQIGGAGSVGTASLRGFATLLRLRGAGFRVWPFDPSCARGKVAAAAGGGDVHAAEYGRGAQVESGGTCCVPAAQAA